MEVDVKELVESHINFARHLAMRFCSKHKQESIDESDVLSEAYLGLCRAGQNFDSNVGVPFSAYAGIRIRGSMLDYYKKHGPIPRAQIDKEKRTKGMRITAQPSCNGHSIKEKSFRFAPFEFHSINVNGFLICERDPQTSVEETDLHNYILEKIADLKEDERQVIWSIFFQDCKAEELCSVLGNVSKSRISQIKKRALAKLKRAIKSDGLSVSSLLGSSK